MIIRICDIVRDLTGEKCIVYQISKDEWGDWFFVVYPDGETDAFRLQQLSLVKPAIAK